MKYSNRTLQENWFENRLEIEKVKNTGKYTRQREESISCLGAAGIPKHLNVMTRVKRWTTQFVIPNDGFRELSTTTKAHFAHSKQASPRRETPQLMTPAKAVAMAPIYRNSPCPWLGYNFKDPNRPRPLEKRYFDTSYADAVNSREFVLPNKRSESTDLRSYDHPAGLKYLGGFMDSVKAKGEILTAEILRGGPDPQHNTEIQKTWVPGGDSGVSAKKSFPAAALPTRDNYTSLPIGDGAYSKRARSEVPSGNRRIRTDITKMTRLHLDMSLR